MVCVIAIAPMEPFSLHIYHIKKNENELEASQNEIKGAINAILD
jgi:hypothetical protein